MKVSKSSDMLRSLKRCKTLLVPEHLIPRLKADTFRLTPVIEENVKRCCSRRFKFKINKNAWLDSLNLKDVNETVCTIKHHNIKSLKHPSNLNILDLYGLSPGQGVRKNPTTINEIYLLDSKIRKNDKTQINTNNYFNELNRFLIKSRQGNRKPIYFKKPEND